MRYQRQLDVMVVSGGKCVQLTAEPLWHGGPGEPRVATPQEVAEESVACAMPCYERLFTQLCKLNTSVVQTVSLEDSSFFEPDTDFYGKLRKLWLVLHGGACKPCAAR